MNLKRILALLAVFVLCMVIDVVPTRAQDFLVQQHSITIDVENLEDALRYMSVMPGFELSSQVSIANGHGSAVRMVQNRDLHQTLDQIKGLGNVTRADSSARNFFDEWSSLTAEFTVRNREYDRMMELLHEATYMEQFNQIERRLRQIISHQEQIRGQLNSIEFEMGSARVNIALNLYIPAEEQEYIPEPEPEPEEPVVIGRLRSIGDAFLRSASMTFAAVQATLIFLARISIPVAVAVVLCVIGFRIVRNRMAKAGKDEKNEKIQVI